MRRSGNLAALAVAVVIGTSGVAKAADDVVTGVGTTASSIFAFAMDAFSGPSGESAWGFVEFDLLAGFGTGNIKHLCVSGNRAVFAGPVDTGAFVGSGVTFFVEDGATTGDVDKILIQITDYVPASCPAFPAAGLVPITSGDIKVTDSPTQPPPPPAVTFESLSALAAQYILASGAPGCQGVANAVTSQLSAAAKADKAGNANAKTALIGAFISTISHLDRFLTPAQMDELIGMAAQL